MAFTQHLPPFSAPCRARRGRCTVAVRAAAGKRGFGAAPEPENAAAQAGKAAVQAGTAYWVAAKINVAEVQSSPNARKPLILADGKTRCGPAEARGRQRQQAGGLFAGRRRRQVVGGGSSSG